MGCTTGRTVELPPIPARMVAGLDDPRWAGDRILGSMAIPAAMRAPSGVCMPAALALLADSSLGIAVVEATNHSTSMVTSYLHLEMLGPLPPGLSMARCNAGVRSMRGSFGIAEGVIDDGAGTTLAHSTLGLVLVPRPTSSAQPVGPDESMPTGADFADVDDLLGTNVTSRDSATAEIRFLATPPLANAFGGVHGGMGALMGARAIDLVINPFDEPAEYSLADLRAVFPRPIPTDGGQVRCRVTVSHRGRRLVVARAELFTAGGQLAVAIDVTYTARST